MRRSEESRVGSHSAKIGGRVWNWHWGLLVRGLGDKGATYTLVMKAGSFDDALIRTAATTTTKERKAELRSPARSARLLMVQLTSFSSSFPDQLHYGDPFVFHRTLFEKWLVATKIESATWCHSRNCVFDSVGSYPCIDGSMTSTQHGDISPQEMNHDWHRSTLGIRMYTR